MFGGHWSSASGNINYLICQVTTQNHVIKGSYICTYVCIYLPSLKNV